jgi:hypothetical protein
MANRQRRTHRRHNTWGATLLFPPDPRGTAVVTLQVQGYDNRADVRA